MADWWVKLVGRFLVVNVIWVNLSLSAVYCFRGFVDSKMLSSKVTSLCAEDIERYKDKISIVGGQDPYDFKYNSKTLPLTVDYDRILSYLLNTLSFRTGEPVRNKKSVEAYKSFERGFVKEVKGLKRGDVFAVLGKVIF